MSSQNLDLSGINDKCYYLCNCNYPYYEELREAFSLLWLTGCRVQELFEISRWSYISGYTLRFQPQKGNNEREVVLDASCANFIAAVINQYTPFSGRTYSQLDNLFNKIKSWNFFQTGSKKFSLYIFRYRYVKQLAADGFSISEISSIMGYTNTSTPQAYLDANIIMDFDLPPIPFIDVGGFLVSAANLAVDDGGDGIYDSRSIYGDWVGLRYTKAAAQRVLATMGGYRLITYSEWNYYISHDKGGASILGKIKEIGTAHWLSPNSGASNYFGFNLLPCGGGTAISDSRIGMFAIMLIDKILSTDRYYATYSYNTGGASFGRSDSFGAYCVRFTPIL